MIFIDRDLYINPDLAIQAVIEVQLHFLASLPSFYPQMLKLTGRYHHILKLLKPITEESKLQSIATVIVIVVHVLHPNGLFLGHSLRGA